MPYMYDNPGYGATHYGNVAKGQQQYANKRTAPRDSYGSDDFVEHELSHPAYEAGGRESMDWSGTWEDANDNDSEDDFLASARPHRHMSFGGSAYPPVPPDPRTLPPPSFDDWFDVPAVAPARYDQPAQQAIEQPPAMQTFPVAQPGYPVRHANDFYVAPQAIPAAYAPYGLPAWSPSNAYPAPQPIGYRAPVLHPRHVQLAEPLITPHDTYRYPTAHTQHIYVPSPTAALVEEPTKEQVNYAMAAWYVDQVILHLSKPGLFRPGVGGQADDEWSPEAKVRDSWTRMGLFPPKFPNPWGRMGMTETPKMPPLVNPLVSRRPSIEKQDPYSVCRTHFTADGRSASLVAFVNDMLQRMTISPTAVVAAAWYVAGLGLHEGDGTKGAKLRGLLRKQAWAETEAVEKRVAMLGLLLAGKWLDDNSFLTKSWNEVTHISNRDIDRLERCALADLHFSLYIPVSSWVDHVNQHYASVMCKDMPDDVDAITAPILDRMVTEAREAELSDPIQQQVYSPYGNETPDFERRLSVEVVPAADQAISRDWGRLARSYAIGGGLEDGEVDDNGLAEYGYSSEVDVEMELGRQVSALVDDVAEGYDADLAVQDEEEDEEEFLDYDGAKPWLPSRSEIRRSASGSSAEMIQEWRSALGKGQHSRNVSGSSDVTRWERSSPTAVGCAQCESGGRHAPPPSGRSHRKYSNEYAATYVDFAPPVPPQSIRAAVSYESEDEDENGTVFLEPGISIVRPPPPPASGHWVPPQGMEGKGHDLPFYPRSPSQRPFFCPTCPAQAS